jgi:methanogenic corrinoid protein MtbC1
MIKTELTKSIEAALMEGDKDLTIEMLISAAMEDGFRNVIVNVLEPLLVNWGTRWMKGELSLAHGYLSGKVAEEFFLVASKSDEFKKEQVQKKGTIVIGNIEDDFHPLGRRLVSTFAKSSGWDVIDLGNDVLAETFIDEALKNQAGIVAVSAMMFTTAKNIASVREEIDRKNLNSQLKLAVGGAVFKLNPDLVKDVGGDGTAENALQAPALFDHLYAQIENK